MVRHTVAFTLKYPKGSPQEKEFLEATVALKKIPGVQHFERLKQTSKKNRFDFGLSMEYSGQKEYEPYTNHPIHTGFIQQHWIPGVEDFLETDYELYSH